MTHELGKVSKKKIASLFIDSFSDVAVELSDDSGLDKLCEKLVINPSVCRDESIPYRFLRKKKRAEKRRKRLFFQAFFLPSLLWPDKDRGSEEEGTRVMLFQ